MRAREQQWLGEETEEEEREKQKLGTEEKKKSEEDTKKHTSAISKFLRMYWIKDLVREKEMKMEKVDDPMIPSGWIV